MEKKYSVIVCSNAATDYIEECKDILVFRSVIEFGDEVFDDYVDMTASEFYNRCKTDKSCFPHTAYVSMGYMIDTFERLKSEGYSGALVVTISGGLSGLNKAVTLAASNVSDFEVVSFDSKTLSYPEALMAQTAYEMFNNGKGLAEVISKLEYIRDNNHIFFAVDTLEYLIKNGRLGKMSGAIAQMLKIRPVLEITKDGKVGTVEKTRTSVKARCNMLDRFLEEIKGKDVIPFFVNTNNDEGIESVKKELLEVRPDFENIKTYMLTPVVGAHAGPGTIGLGYILKKASH